jgi:CRP/FNR family cyclic AMP-dependent transcriptional regulator
MNNRRPTSYTPTSSIEEGLTQVPLFAHVSGRHLARLAHLATRRSYRADSVVVRQGDTSMSFYVILSGTVRLTRESEDGQSVPIAEVGPGGFFGEMGLIDDQPRSVTVTAVTPTECALLAKWDFQNELHTEPEVALALLPLLTSRIRDLESQVSHLSVGG